MLLIAGLLAAGAPDCRNVAAQSDMNRCAALGARRADARLNAAWKALAAHGDAGRGGLLEAQRQWLRFRDAECRAEAAMYEGGSMQPMVQAQCVADLTDERAKRLEALAQDAAR